MGAADPVLIEELRQLRDELAALEVQQRSVTGFEQFRESWLLRRAVERGLEICVEACLAMGRRIIAADGLRFAENNKDVFKVLGEAGILGPDVVATMTKMAGFRNLVVHEYVRIDPAVVFAILRNDLGDFDEFAASVVAYMKGE